MYHWSKYQLLEEFDNYDEREQRATTQRVYTTGLQIILPTPDFSMPYNVICLSGTVWALFFGNVFNALIRRYGQLRKGWRVLVFGNVIVHNLLWLCACRQ
jgi:hypothetical protein